MPTASPDSASPDSVAPLDSTAPLRPLAAPGRASSSAPPVGPAQVGPDAPSKGRNARVGFSSLVRAFASSLVLDPVSEPEPAPFVYTAAIHTTADLVSSLVGITELSREQGFSRDPETNYGNGGRNAVYHADHRELPVSLSVNCNPLRQTVAIAVSGPHGEETYRCFQELEQALFGSC
jgi:hypothetical protein